MRPFFGGLLWLVKVRREYGRRRGATTCESNAPRHDGHISTHVVTLDGHRARYTELRRIVTDFCRPSEPFGASWEATPCTLFITIMSIREAVPTRNAHHGGVWCHRRNGMCMYRMRYSWAIFLMQSPLSTRRRPPDHGFRRRRESPPAGDSSDPSRLAQTGSGWRVPNGEIGGRVPLGSPRVWPRAVDNF